MKIDKKKMREIRPGKLLMKTRSTNRSKF